MKDIEYKEKVAYIDRCLLERTYAEHKVKWYQLTMIVAVFVAGILFARLFL